MRIKTTRERGSIESNSTGVPFNIGILRPLAEQNSTEPEVENRTPANRVCSRDEGTTRERKRWIPLGCHPTHPLRRPPSIRGGRSHMYVGSGHGRPEGGKVIAGIQLMVDALVGLPQLLLDHAPARIARTSRWPNPVGRHRNFAEVQTTHAQRLLGAFWAAGSRRACGNRAAEVSEDDTGYRGGVSDFRDCGLHQRRYVRKDQGPTGKGSGIGHRLEAVSAAGSRDGIPGRRVQPEVPDRGDFSRQRSRVCQSLIDGLIEYLVQFCRLTPKCQYKVAVT